MNSPFWKTKIFIVDFAIYLMFIYLFICIVHTININNDLFIFVILLLLYAGLGAVRWGIICETTYGEWLDKPRVRLSGQEVYGRLVKGPKTDNRYNLPFVKIRWEDTGSTSPWILESKVDYDDVPQIDGYKEGEIVKMRDQDWKKYSGDIFFSLILTNFMIISLATKQQKLFNLCILLLILYFIINSTYKCLLASPIGGSEYLISLLVYVMLLRNQLLIKTGNTLYDFNIYPIICTLCVLLCFIFRGILGRLVGYTCI